MDFEYTFFLVDLEAEEARQLEIFDQLRNRYGLQSHLGDYEETRSSEDLWLTSFVLFVLCYSKTFFVPMSMNDSSSETSLNLEHPKCGLRSDLNILTYPSVA